MNEMIERIAWAMREESELTDCPLTFDICVPLAAIAIKVLHNPTDAMIKAGDHEIPDNIGYENDAKGVYLAMIKKAAE